MDDKYRAFVTKLVAHTAGGPDAGELIAAIEADAVNWDSIGCLLGGFEFESYTEAPKTAPWDQ